LNPTNLIIQTVPVFHTERLIDTELLSIHHSSMKRIWITSCRLLLVLVLVLVMLLLLP
jgi:hypothetical protein